jgi:UDP-glucose 4-epimerase
VVVLDNLCNSSELALQRVQQIAGRSIDFVRGNILDRDDVERALAGGVEAIIHFAALKAVGESCSRPLEYFNTNVAGTINLLQAMDRMGVRKFVFSSSAAVYGNADSMPVHEDSPLRPANPYGRTKLVVEDVIRDYCAAQPGFRAVLLRYFNPIGAHPSGRIGEDPTGIPANHLPYVTQVAIGLRDRLQVFGDDYPTPDGSGVRDYIHVVDLASAHVRAIDFTAKHECCEVFNVGTGHGYSVFEVVEAFERVSGRSIAMEITGRRPGDVPELWADTSRARALLGWRAQYGLERMCADAWRWQVLNPEGYGREATI